MPALTSPEQATWRSNPVSVGAYCFIHAPAVVFKARVNMPGHTIYPFMALVYDTVTAGAYTDIKDGMTLLIGSSDGADDYGRIRVRRSNGGTLATSTIISVQRFSRGTRDGELDIVDNAYITVLDLYQVWAAPPYIGGDGVMWKDGDRSFNATTCYPPVANAGPDTLVVVPSAGNTAALAFGLTPSYKTHPDATSTLTYAWSFPGASPSTSTSATPTVTFTADYVGYISLTVTDSLGNQSTARCLIAVVNRNHANLIKCGKATQVARPEGQTLRLQINQSVPPSTYPDGTEVLICQKERYNTTDGSLAYLTDRKHMLFAGYWHTETASANASERGLSTSLEVDCVDAAGRLALLPAFSQTIERESSPTTWNTLKGLNIDRYVHHLLEWHSTVLQRHDFSWSGTGETYGVRTLGSDGSDLYQQADQRTQAIAHKLTCDRYSRLAMVADPNLQDSGSRTSVVIVPVLESDWSAYSYSYIRPPRIHWNWGEAIVASTLDASNAAELQTVFCAAPGLAPGQGVSSQNSGQQVVTSQTQLNSREGHRYAAKMNAVQGLINLSLSRAGDAGIDPALMQWIQLEITSQAAGRRGRSIVSTTRFLPVEVTYEWDFENGTRTTRLALEKDVTGTPAQSWVPDKNDFITGVDTVIPVVIPVVTFTGSSGDTLGTNEMAMFCSDGNLYRTSSYRTPSSAGGPFWTATSLAGLGMSGTLAMAIPNAYSSKYLGIGSTVDGWLSTYTEVRQITDVGGTPALGTAYPFGYTAAAIHMQSGRLTQNHVVLIASRGSNGQRCIYTTDGSSWSDVLMDANYDYDTGGNLVPAALSEKVPGKVTAIAYISMMAAVGPTKGKRSLDYGATWADLDNSILDLNDSIRPYGDLVIPFHNNPTESIAWITENVNIGFTGWRLRRVNGGTSEVRAPGGGGYFGSFGAPAQFGMSVCPINRSRIVMCGINTDHPTLFERGVWKSNDEGMTWETLIAPATTNDTYHRCAIDGNNPEIMHFWGGNGRIGFSSDGGYTIDDRRGNISTSGSILNIWGL